MIIRDEDPTDLSAFLLLGNEELRPAQWDVEGVARILGA